MTSVKYHKDDRNRMFLCYIFSFIRCMCVILVQCSRIFYMLGLLRNSWCSCKMLLCNLAVRQRSPGLMQTFKPWNTPQYAELIYLESSYNYLLARQPKLTRLVSWCFAYSRFWLQARKGLTSRPISLFWQKGRACSYFRLGVSSSSWNKRPKKSSNTRKTFREKQAVLFCGSKKSSDFKSRF